MNINPELIKRNRILAVDEQVWNTIYKQIDSNSIKLQWAGYIWRWNDTVCLQFRYFKTL